MKTERVTNKWEKINTVFLYGVFLCYILFLIKLLLLSRINLSDLFGGMNYAERSINLVPFKSISGYIFTTSETVKRFAFSNVIGNIIAFIPLGAFLSLLKPKRKAASSLLIVFAVSLLVETIHGIFAIGTADVDDIILNCIGGGMGILGYKLLLLILRDKNKVRIAAAVVSVICLPYLLYLLFMVNLRL